MMKTLRGWLEDQKNNEQTASRRLHLHFLHPRTRFSAKTARSWVCAWSANKLDGKGGIIGTGEYVDYPVQAVYRAIGYFGSELPEVGYDSKRGVVTNVEGRVVDENGELFPACTQPAGSSAAPWALIGSTKSDALETITHLLEDRENLYPRPSRTPKPSAPTWIPKASKYTTWEGWHRLDDHEKSTGRSIQGRCR